MALTPISDLPGATSVAASDTVVLVQDGVTKKATAAVLVDVLSPAEGAFEDGDKTKLDGIESGADVTDTANVTEAGALMDSEVANLADVKAFDPADYATVGQGELADSAIQPAEIADFETTAELNARDTNNRARANHTGVQAQSTVTNLVSDLAAKAPLASPALTGNPTAPTQTAGDNSTNIATTAYVDAAGGGGVGLSPISKTVISGTPSAIDVELTGYDCFVIRFQSVDYSNSSVDLRATVSDDGGSTFKSSDYRYALKRSPWTVDPIYYRASSLSYIRMITGAAPSVETNGIVTITVNAGSGTKSALSWDFVDADERNTGGGTCDTGGTPDYIRFSISAGTFTSGEIHVYGYEDGDS